MEKQEIISIIVPVYNVESYFPKCIESICNQTYYNLEIILVDDGSTDESGTMCDQYAQKDKRIKVIHKKNGGLADARNVGIEVATGEYLAFVDSDDYIHPQMYEIFYRGIQKNNAQMAVCQFQDVEENEVCFKTLKHKKEWIIIESEDEKFKYSLGDYTTVCFTVAWNKLYRAELFKDIRYPYGKIHEDEFTTYKIIELCNKIVYTDEILYYYVQRKDSITHLILDERRLLCLNAYQERMELYQQKARYDWYERMLFLYRLKLLYWTEIYIERNRKDMLLLLKPYKKYYNQKVFRYVWRLPKGKKGYLYYALFSKSYYRNRYICN